MALRRKYDHSIFSGSDVQESGRPSERESIYNTRASSPQQYQQQQRSPRFSNVGGKAMFDLDAFFQAHYGEQLQREKELRSRRAQYQQKQQHDYKQWKLGKMLEITVGVLLAMSGQGSSLLQYHQILIVWVLLAMRGQGSSSLSPGPDCMGAAGHEGSGVIFTITRS
ncbi:dnaJ homolog subfamily C member 30, mitochondrial [Oncorhynchus tshawytscha]|uniref:dnaJ homolog subfamily C member 30, mitochondrial n=1 Tax=Oncorhynchus tshawytscha TaxID=74940 RepID=UPI001C3D2FFE|nr:dnaJ homolog subfamily C member 30, mitochondrial [Oncorhynchus tshawytscha]